MDTPLSPHRAVIDILRNIFGRGSPQFVLTNEPNGDLVIRYQRIGKLVHVYTIPLITIVPNTPIGIEFYNITMQARIKRFRKHCLFLNGAAVTLRSDHV